MKNKRYALLSIVILILLWGVIAKVVDNSVKIPSPKETAFAFINIVTNKYFYVQIVNTLRRVVIGYFIAFTAGVGLGMISGFFDPIYYLLHPIVLIQRSVPTMAVILLTLIWLNREIAPILVGVLVIFPIIYSAVVEGIRNIDVKLLEMAKIYHLSRRKKLMHLYLPSIQSSLMAVLVATISLNIKVTIAAEVLSQPKHAIGTGFQMEKVALNTAGVFAWAVIAILIAGIFEMLVSFRFIEWIKVVKNRIGKIGE